MNTVHFSEFLNKYSPAAYAFHRAMEHCRLTGAKRLVVDGDRYVIDYDYCSERNLCYSNHDKNGPKRIMALIEDMENFEIDFGGATLDCRGIMTPVAILRSKNIKIKNLTLENSTTGFLQLRVTAHNADGSVECEYMCGGDNFTLVDGHYYVKYPYLDALFPLHMNIEYNGKTGEIEYGTHDDTLGIPASRLTFTELGEGKYLVKGGTRQPPVGNILVISGTRRLGAGFFLSDSENIEIENVTVHSCYGMGLIAQMCENITLRRFNTLRHGVQYYTSDADATHFVNCTGVVLVEDCTFEGQLDDALNIHGIYTRIVGKGKRELLVREMHHQALGIRIYREGDRIQALPPSSLIPYAEATVKAVEYINEEMIRLTLEEDTDGISVGDDIESVNRAPELIFRGNTVRNNRARGMLIATRGKATIENCYFHSSGSAIKFESDGNYWFESGGTTDVTVRGCKFDRCKHGGWGDAIIECQPRNEIVEGKYFHKKITVENNEFYMHNDYLAAFYNVELIGFDGNKVYGTDGKAANVEFSEDKDRQYYGVRTK